MTVWIEWIRPHTGPDGDVQVFSTKENVVGYWDELRKRNGFGPMTDVERDMSLFDMEKNGGGRMPVAEFGPHGLAFSHCRRVEVDEYYTKGNYND